MDVEIVFSHIRNIIYRTICKFRKFVSKEVSIDSIFILILNKLSMCINWATVIRFSSILQISLPSLFSIFTYKKNLNIFLGYNNWYIHVQSLNLKSSLISSNWTYNFFLKDWYNIRIFFEIFRIYFYCINKLVRDQLVQIPESKL